MSNQGITPATRALRTADRVLPGLLAAAAIATFIRLSHGLSLIVTFVPTMVLSYVMHQRTTARRLPSPDRVVPLYLVALAIQFLHFSEEFVTGFYERWPVEMFKAKPYSLRTWILINTISYAVFTAAVVGLYRGIRTALLPVWFFTIMGVIGNAIQHPLYCLKVRGYFPGFWTSLAYWVLGPLLYRRLTEGRGTER